MTEPLSPDTGCFRLFSLFSSWRASARLRLKRKKFPENFSVAGASSFYGADFCHNDKKSRSEYLTYLQGFCESQGKNQPIKTDESSVIFSQIPLPVPKDKNSPLSRTVFFRQFSLFCLVITLYNVKGYAAFHKTSTADAVPEVFCSLATSQSIFALQKSLLRRTLFRCAKQVR